MAGRSRQRRGESAGPIKRDSKRGVTRGARALERLVASGEQGLEAGKPELADLLAQDLATERDGRVVATPAGRAKAAREAHEGEPFLAQHRTVERRTVLTDEGRRSLLVDLDESPLAWLARRKGKDGAPLLSVAEVAAGEKLRADFTRAQMAPRVTANWEAAVSSGRRGRGGGVAELADAAIAARVRVNRAVEAVGPELSGALLDVCCFLKGVEEVERERGWPARGAKLVLGLALSRLARHYGLTTEGRGGGRIVAWGAPDSRPTIDGA